MDESIDNIFPHLGEEIIEKILEEFPDLVLNQINLPGRTVKAVHRQIPLSFPNTDLLFDGFSTIDLGLELDDDSLVPIEVKLGNTGLTRAVSNRKLTPCKVSGHKSEMRVSGNVLAILNRQFDGQLTAIIAEDSLHGRLTNRLLGVTEAWAIIARNHVIASWERAAPNFNSHHTKISLEALCEHFGRERFNTLVRDLLADVDYFERWIGTEAEVEVGDAGGRADARGSGELHPRPDG